MPKRRIDMRVDLADLERWWAAAKEFGVTLSELIRAAINEYLERMRYKP